MLKDFFYRIILCCVFLAIPSYGQNINAFCTAGRIIPPASNDFIVSPAGGNFTLQQTTVTEKINPGEIVCRLGFSSNDYCLFKGEFAPKAIEQDIFIFSIPQGVSFSQIIYHKFYAYERNTNPDNDIRRIYFDNVNIYVELLSTIYWNDNGIMRSLQGICIKDSRARRILWGDVNITFSPAHAEFFFNNRKQEIENPGVVFIRDRFPGEYKISASLGGYQAKEKNIIVRPGVITYDTIILPPAYGTLILKDISSGFGYVIDGEKVAAGLRHVTPRKPHKVVFDGRELYKSIDTTIIIDSGGQTTLGEQCVRLIGGIKIIPSPLDAEVFIDNVLLGAGPNVVENIPTGPHVVSAKRTGYTLVKADVFVKDGETFEIGLTLPQIPDRDGDGIEDNHDECPDDPGTAEFNGCRSAWTEEYSLTTFPSGANVSGETKSLGLTPLSIALRPGKHSFLISKNDYNDTAFQIDVRESAGINRSYPEELVFNLNHSKAFLDSLEIIKTKAHKKSMRIRQVVFGALGAGLAGGGYYYNKRYDNVYKEYAATKDTDIADAKWKTADKYRNYRNLLYIGAGTFAGLFTISFLF